MIFASFIRKPEDVHEIRECLVKHDEKLGEEIMIISKIENQEGMAKFDNILRVTDGVMVARGDLGIEIPVQKVFMAQKMMCAKCNMVAKPVIVATQMLESMTKNPRPTRAEASDAANAVLDGADCVMLSGETAKGRYPVETVQMMDSICREAEGAINRFQYYAEIRQSLPSPLPTEEVVANSAVMASFEQKAGAIIVLTNSGTTARLVSKFRPACPIIAVMGSSSARQRRQLELSANVFGVWYDDSKGKLDADARVRKGLEFGRKQGWLSDGTYVVCVHADTMGKGHANLVRILQS
jgi:pyruvate kinase